VCGIRDAAGVAAGSHHTCALHRAGRVSCWSRGKRREIPGLDDAVQIAAAGGETCAVRKSGALRCWREGDRNSQDEAGISDALRVAVGPKHRCVLRRAGTVTCSGDNAFGQLGDGAKTARTSPVEVAQVSGVQALAVERARSCAVDKSGELWCWGVALSVSLQPVEVALVAADGFGFGCFKGPCPPPPTRKRLRPADPLRPIEAQVAHARPIEGIADVVQLANGPGTCGRKRDGTVWCWEPGKAPRAVIGIGAAVQICGIWSYGCAALRDGTVKCWGSFPRPWAQDPGAYSNDEPSAIPGIAHVVEVACGDYHACARLSDGGVQCWGSNRDGRLGDGTAEERKTPVAVVGLRDAREIAAGGSESCARVASGELWCWGSAGATPRKHDLPPVQAIGESRVDACAVGRDGRVRCRGHSDIRLIPDLASAARVYVGPKHSCALERSGRVFCWGKNDHGELGDGTLASRTNPAPMLGVDDAVDVAVGSERTCVLRKAGTVGCTGKKK
jgi:alpha-tubulin suppressor-like RCC1 family protein